jgi:hypothetical protein
LGRRNLDRATCLLKELREANRFVARLHLDADEILGDSKFPKKSIECKLQVRLLSNRKGTQCGIHFVRAARREVADEPLKCVPVGAVRSFTIRGGR